MSRWLRLAHHAGIIEQASDDLEPVTYLAKVPHGPIITLAGTAHVIWTEALADSLDDLAERVAAHFGLSAADIAADVGAFVDELVQATMVTVDEDGRA